MAERSKEVDWLFSVLDESSVDLKALCLLTPAAVQPTLKDAIGAETAYLFADYMEVSQAYEEFMSFPYEETRQEEAEALAEAVADSLRAICRIARRDPTILSQIKRDKTIVKKPWFGMINAVFEYADLVKKKLNNLNADGDEASNDQRLDELLQTQREAEARESELRETLRSERQLRAEHHAQATSKGEKLQREISKMQQQADARRQFVMSAADDELKAEFERHATALKKYEAEIERLESKLDSDQKENLGTEQDHKKKLIRLEDETAKTISDYDYVMTEKTQTYTRLREMYEAESASLRAVSAQNAALVAEREAHERAIADEEARVAAIALRRFQAAVKIQALIRGFLVRRRLKREKDKAAGKKGGAKKAAGKKK